MIPHANGFCRGAGWVISLAVCLPWGIPARSVADGRDEWQQPDQVMADMNLQPAAYVADVGCGTGYFTFRIARAVGMEGQVFAVDIDAKALEAIKTAAEEDKFTNIQTIHSEPTDAKLEPGCADAALLCLVLHHVPKDQRQPLMASIARSLKPDGLLFVIDLRKVQNPPFHTYDELVARDEVTQMAAAVGLSLDAEYYYLPYQYYLRFRKPQETMVFDFERYPADQHPEGWECRGSNGYASQLAVGEEQRAEQPTRVLRMDYNFEANAAEGYSPEDRKSCIAGTWEQLPGVVHKVRVDVKGDGSGNSLVISVGEPTVEWFDYEVGPITWTGWQTVEVDIDEHWRGNGGDGANGVIEPPLFFVSLNVEQIGPARGTICFDNIVCIHERPAN